MRLEISEITESKEADPYTMASFCLWVDLGYDRMRGVASGRNQVVESVLLWVCIKERER